MISYVFEWVKAVLWSGSAEYIQMTCHEDDYSEFVDMAQGLRKALDIPVSVKIGDKVDVEGLSFDVDKDNCVLVTSMSKSVFKPAYYAVAMISE
jgi:hypothetical protein